MVGQDSPAGAANRVLLTASVMMKHAVPVRVRFPSPPTPLAGPHMHMMSGNQGKVQGLQGYHAIWINSSPWEESLPVCAACLCAAAAGPTAPAIIALVQA
eukprot:329520-Chlamydomonas_euryale.AAC.5